MKPFTTILLSGALLLAAGTASADATPIPKIPRVYTASHQPSGRPTKASSFAPHSSRSKRHVYGAPIQSPIFKMQPRPRKTAQPPPVPKRP